MKVVVITGSGRRRGTSSYLADEFIRGCIENDNEVFLGIIYWRNNMERMT